MHEKNLEGDLIVSEGKSIEHLLHLRLIGKEGPNFSNLSARALCDEELAWDTQIPVSDWADPRGKPYCTLCLLLAERKGLC
jgi:hypothetical protein